jgi:hypothetical protein
MALTSSKICTRCCELGQAGTLAGLWPRHEGAPRCGSYARRRRRMPSAHPPSRQRRSAPYRITAAMTRGAGNTGRLQQPPCSSDPRPEGDGMKQLRSFLQCFGPSHLCGRRPAEPCLSCRAALVIVLSSAALASRDNPGRTGMHAEIFAIGTELLMFCHCQCRDRPHPGDAGGPPGRVPELCGSC